MEPEKRKKIIHLTVVHNFGDNRIYNKMYKSCKKNKDYEVAYISKKPNNPEDLSLDSSDNIFFLPLTKGIFGRVIRNIKAVFYCFKFGKGIVHFHDMEFIPWALLLKILGWKVIYDVHEDNLLGIMQKEYLPKPARKILYYFVFMLEGLAKKCFVIIIAEKCYKKRFPESVMILNYPLITDKVNKNYTESDSGDEFNLIYTGCISTDRGAFLVLDLLKLIPEVKLTMVGRCAKKLREEMEEYAGDAGKRLELLTDETFVPFDTIKHFYTSRAWAAGLAVFPQTPHYYEKELTKFYEYMIYGIPVIASNFPVWEKLIVGNNAGIVVDPADKELDKAAILKFLNDKELRRKISDSGYSTVYEKFNWLGEEQKLFSVYSEIQ